MHLVPGMKERYAASGWSAPYTTAQPDVTRHTLTGDDHFMVLSTDGVFETLNCT
jgi:serine/threonine protein phosphatase PrpC